MKNNACKRISIDREVVEQLSTEANLDGSRICQGSISLTESFLMDRESVEKLSRQSPEISMDRDCDNFYRDKKKKGA